MSVLIKGMEMPTSPVLFCIHPDGKVFADLEGGWREYKAVPVPDHGRLIDADALPQNRMTFNGVRFIKERFIKEASVVIPSDKERNG